MSHDVRRASRRQVRRGVLENLVITKMEPGEKEGETVLYCDDLGYEYEYKEKR